MSDTVLHVIPSVSPRDGGPASAVLGMCRALIASGRPAEIATTDADGPARLPVELGVRLEYQGVPVTFFRRVLDGGLKWSPDLSRWLQRHIEQYRVAHLHAVFSHAPLAAGKACRRVGLPYVVRPLGTLDPWSLRRKALRKRMLWYGGVRRLLQGAAAMHYTTAAEGRLAERAVGPLPQGVVVPIGVEDEWFQLASADRLGTCRMLSLSRLDPKKNLESLIAAFHQVAVGHDGDRWTLTIAGDGRPEYVARLRALAQGGPAHARIDFPGWVSGRAKRQLLETSSLFVLPSSQENFGIAVGEALAAGIPVVVSPQVNLAEDITLAEAGWVTDDQPSSLGQVLRTAMRSDTERARRGALGAKFAASFRWPLIAERISRAYDAITGDDRPVVAALSHVPVRSASRH